MPFTLPRDSSANELGVSSYQDSADATDVILWGTRTVTDTVTTSAAGIATVVNKPIIDVTHDREVGGIYDRSRLINSLDVSAVRTAGGATIYVGILTQTQAKSGQVPIFSDSGLTTPLASTQVNVTYRYPVPLAVDATGATSSTLSGAVDVSDRSARLLGVTDVSDRSARLLGTVTSITNALPAGTNNIGDVDVLTLPALPAGTNNIGDVDVLTLPALPTGTNTIGGTNRTAVRGIYHDDTVTIGLPAANAQGNGATRDALGSNADGTARDAPARVRALARANQTGTLGLDFTRDTSGTPTWRPWRRLATTAIATGENVAEIDAPLIGRGWRVIWISGGTAPTQLDIVSGQVAV